MPQVVPVERIVDPEPEPQAGLLPALVGPVEEFGVWARSTMSAIDRLVLADPVAQFERNRGQGLPQRRPVGLVEPLQARLGRQAGRQDRAAEQRALKSSTWFLHAGRVDCWVGLTDVAARRRVKRSRPRTAAPRARRLRGFRSCARTTIWQT